MVVKHMLTARRDRVGRLGTSEYVDIHCVPGLGDGTSTVFETVALCKAAAGEGIKTVIATPHQLGRFDDSYCAKEVREAVTDLNRLLSEQRGALTVVPRVDNSVDENPSRVPEGQGLAAIWPLRQQEVHR